MIYDPLLEGAPSSSFEASPLLLWKLLALLTKMTRKEKSTKEMAQPISRSTEHTMEASSERLRPSNLLKLQGIKDYNSSM